MKSIFEAGAASSVIAAPIDPRSRLLLAAVLSVAIACLTNLRGALAALGIAFLLLSLCRPPLARFLKSLAAANIFILFIWLLVPFTAPGDPLFRWGFLALTRQGVDLCLLATVKGNALLIIFLAMVAPMSITCLGNALRTLHCPDKLTWLFLLMGRNIHLLAREWKSLQQAAKLRGFRPGNDKNTYRTLASMLALLLMRSHDRAMRMREAMLLRGFTGKLPAGAPLRFTSKDVLAAIFLLACLAFIWLMEAAIDS